MRIGVLSLLLAGLFCVSPARAAVSAQCAEQFAKLERLDPKLSKIALQAKIAAAPDPFHFFRSFVPLFYELIANDAEHSRRFASLRKHKGWMVGDAHPENFGALLKEDGRAIFTMNDVDDGSAGLVYLDVLRYFTSLRLYKDSFDFGPAMDAYRKGLRGESKAPGAPVRDLLQKSEANGLGISGKRYDSNSKKLIRSEDTSELSRATYHSLEQLLSEVFAGKIELQDAVRKKRVHGGSGGLDRIEAVVKAAEDNVSGKKRMVLELKELKTPGTFPVTGASSSSQAQRIHRGLDTTLGKDHPTFYQVVELDGVSYLMRPRWSGNIGVALDDYTTQQVQSIVEDESFRLGQIHAASLTNVDAYLRDLSGFSKVGWTAESDRIADKIRESFSQFQSSEE